MISKEHIIDRLRVEVLADDHRIAGAAQQELGFRLHTAGFLQRLDELFNSVASQEEYIEIDQLRLRLTCGKTANISEMLLKELEMELRRRIAGSSPGIRKTSGEDFEKQVGSAFLLSGILLYPEGREALDHFRNKVLQLPDKDNTALEKLIAETAAGHPVVWKRLFFLLGQAGIMKYCERVFNIGAAYFETAQPSAALFSAGQYNGPSARLQDPGYWAIIIPALIKASAETHETNAPPAVGTMEAKFPAGTSDAEILQPGSPRKDTLTVSAEGLPVGNAGVVLLWMEFGQLLRKLHYVEGKQFISETAQRHAALLLHHICWGSADAYEEQLTLNKLLCGWPLDEPLNIEDAPSGADMQEAGNVLDAYLAAWKKDRKYSREWFRATFLQREGKLSARLDGNWRLEVMKKTEDILLNKASVVKYSWMQQILFVQW